MIQFFWYPAIKALFSGDTKATIEFLDDAVGVRKGTAVERAHPFFHDEPAAQVYAFQLDCVPVGIDDLSSVGVEHAQGREGLVAES